MKLKLKWIWSIIWAFLVVILFTIYSFSQANAVEVIEGYETIRVLPPGSIISADDIRYSKNIVVPKEKIEQVVKDKGKIIGKRTNIGMAKGEPITQEKLKSRHKNTSELTISTSLGNIPHPVENLKVADIWVDYNPKEYGDLRPTKIATKVPVKSVRNRRTTEVSVSDDKVPAIVVVETNDATIAKIKEYSRKGSIFFTNPYPEEGGR